MAVLRTLGFISLAAAGIFANASPRSQEPFRVQKRQATPIGTGTHDGFFYSWWSDGGSPVNYTNLEGGSYRVEWESGGNFVGGKGWNPGLTQR